MTENIGATDFMRLFLASVLGAIAGIMFSRINLYSHITQTWGILWFLSASALLYIIYFYLPTIIADFIAKFIPKPKKRWKLSKYAKDLLLLILALLLFFIVFYLPQIFPAWFNS